MCFLVTTSEKTTIVSLGWTPQLQYAHESSTPRFSVDLGIDSKNRLGKSENKATPRRIVWLHELQDGRLVHALSPNLICFGFQSYQS